MQPFNPFTSRQKNTNVKWFEADLEKFYTFVENQPLLSAAQEQLYGKALKMWFQVELKKEKLIEMSLNQTITSEMLARYIGCSEQTLGKMEKYADISKLKLVNSNLKLVLAVVSRYRTSGIPNSELIAEGTRGLSKAVLRYDYSKGFRFATYATWYVHQAISEYVRWRKHPAKMPSRYLLLLRRVKQYSAEYKLEHNSLPSVNELVNKLDASHYDISKVLSMQQYPLLLYTQIPHLNSYKQDGRDKTYEDLLPSVYKAPLAHSDSKDLRRDMEKMMLVNLNDVERDVLRLRLGLDDGRAKPVKEVGKRFKISWKQVRSVEKEAISKLLHSEEIDEFVQNFQSV
jgi:RNA polymerase sigma factor (sigma-70 family)